MAKRITEAFLKRLAEHDEEVCTDVKVWKEFLKENDMPCTQEGVLAWMMPPPRQED